MFEVLYIMTILAAIVAIIVLAVTAVVMWVAFCTEILFPTLNIWLRKKFNLPEKKRW